jgi:hypothetical protein
VSALTPEALSARIAELEAAVIQARHEALNPRCVRCNLDLTRVAGSEGIRFMCVCCDPTFQKGTLQDCHHLKIG